MIKVRDLKTFCYLFCFLLLNACSTTRLSAVWSTSTPPKDIDSLVVVGIDPSEADRRVFENVFVDALRSQGLTAYQSYKILPDDERATTEALGPFVRDHSIDAILVSSVLAVEREQRYVESTPYARPFGFYGLYDSYYPWAYNRVYAPGYFVNYKEYFLETNLYDARSGKLLFTATSETTDPDSVAELSKSLAKEIVKALQNTKLIGPADRRGSDSKA